ncbi:GINS complex subunit [Toensbergia leucococca]|nr:GINS complex subunit [Toensbergia leucococca]
MDIDDILAEVDSHIVPQETRDLQELTRLWVTERSAPEILQWPETLMERIMDRIRQQIELVEMQTGNMDPKTNFRLIIIQTELERFKFLVRSFLRARIAKIDKHALYILTTHTQTSRLSSSELQYLTTHQSLLQAHYLSSFLSQFPPSLQRLDDTAGGISMIEQPDLEKAVFVRGLRDVAGPIVVEGTDTEFEMKRGDVNLAPQDGSVELPTLVVSWPGSIREFAMIDRKQLDPD